MNNHVYHFNLSFFFIIQQHDCSRSRHLIVLIFSRCEVMLLGTEFPVDGQSEGESFYDILSILP